MRTISIIRSISAIPLRRTIAFATGLVVFANVRGELIVYDGFDYPHGASLEGRGYDGFHWGTNRWLKHYATSDWFVFSNSLAHPSIPTTGGHVAETNNIHGADYERKFVTHVLGDDESVWFSFLVKITQGATWNFSFTSSGLSSSQISVQGFDYRIQARIGQGYSGSTNMVELGQNTTRLIVGRYRYSASDVEQLDLWVDPDIASEPQPGGASSSNHIVHVRQLDSEPDRIDSVLLEDRSIGSLAFDELRVGTRWADVISRALDSVIIDSIAATGNEITLEMSRLTPGATTTVERATELFAPQWESVGTFVPSVRSTNWAELLPAGDRQFYRVRTR
ncbi:MAG: hypothetical protein IH623_19290 [Verrucomicrobia bacterium]|nr:hypothetical protein [Verrucomicrobiota bacterium]